MPPIYTLNKLKRGIPAVVLEVQTAGTMRRRLIDIGLAPGKRVQALFKSCSGDPTAYLVEDTVFALRREDAQTVLVAPAQV